MCHGVVENIEISVIGIFIESKYVQASKALPNESIYYLGLKSYTEDYMNADSSHTGL